jgi:hypothetical protein
MAQMLRHAIDARTAAQRLDRVHMAEIMKPERDSRSSASHRLCEGRRDRAARIKANERIMDDLLVEGRIASKPYGPKSKDKWRLEVVSRTLPLHSEKENKDDEHEG